MVELSFRAGLLTSPGSATSATCGYDLAQLSCTDHHSSFFRLPSMVFVVILEYQATKAQGEDGFIFYPAHVDRPVDGDLCYGASCPFCVFPSSCLDI